MRAMGFLVRRFANDTGAAVLLVKRAGQTFNYTNSSAF